jgi:hypothetical protein
MVDTVDTVDTVDMAGTVAATVDMGAMGTRIRVMDIQTMDMTPTGTEMGWQSLVDIRLVRHFPLQRVPR